MPTSDAEVYLPLLFQIFIAIAVAAGMLLTSYLVGKRVRNRVKDMPYECGIVPTGSARERFSVKFYMVAMVFVLFDIEAVFLYPWAVVYRQFRVFAFFEMFLFLVLILSGFFYIWKKGILDWSPGEEDSKRGGDRHGA